MTFALESHGTSYIPFVIASDHKDNKQQYIILDHHTWELDTDYTQIWEANVGYQLLIFPQTEFHGEASEVHEVTIHDAAAQTAPRTGSIKMCATLKAN